MSRLEQFKGSTWELELVDKVCLCDEHPTRGEVLRARRRTLRIYARLMPALYCKMAYACIDLA